MQQQSNMAAYNQPSAFDKFTSVAVPLASAAILASDKRVKTNIGDATSEIDQFISSVKPYSFEYSHVGYGQPGTHYGVMAQELEQTPAGASTVVEAQDGVKMVDLRRLVPLMMASMGRMAQRIEELERSR